MHTAPALTPLEFDVPSPLTRLDNLDLMLSAPAPPLVAHIRKTTCLPAWLTVQDALCANVRLRCERPTTNLAPLSALQ